MSNQLRFFAEGLPASQGSKIRGRGMSMREADKKLPAWRKAVIEAATTEAGPNWAPLDGPLVCHLDVFLPAPGKSKFGLHPAGTPDLDKLQRAVGDALTQANVIVDDARIVRWIAEKHWGVSVTGAAVTITRLPERPSA